MKWPVADLGGVPGVRPPYGPKFSQFHAVFSQILAKSYVGVPLEGWRGILDPPLVTGDAIYFCQFLIGDLSPDCKHAR